MGKAFTLVGSTCNQVFMKWNRECWLSNANNGEASVPEKTKGSSPMFADEG